MSALQSIPSPDESFRVFSIPIGEWLQGIGVPSGFAINIHAYALFILVGIVFAVILTDRRLTKRGAEPGVVLDVALFVVPLGIIGARIFHVVTHPDDYFDFSDGQDPLRFLYIWEGGLAIFGGIMLGAVGVYLGCRFRGLRFWSFADALVPGLLLAQVFGRLGNYFNQELFGLPTDAPWGLEIDRPNSAIPVGLPDDTLFQPTFLYEMAWNVVGVVVLLWLGRKLQWGRLVGVYLIWYGAGRIVWENIRIDPSEIVAGLRVNVWAAIIAVVVGIVIFVVQGRRHPGGEPSPYLPGREWGGPEAEVDSEETYSDTDEPGDDATSVAESNSESTLATSAAGSRSS